jgi:hypothetical protein
MVMDSVSLLKKKNSSDMGRTDSSVRRVARNYGATGGETERENSYITSQERTLCSWIVSFLN